MKAKGIEHGAERFELGSRNGEREIKAWGLSEKDATRCLWTGLLALMMETIHESLTSDKQPEAGDQRLQCPNT